MMRVGQLRYSLLHQVITKHYALIHSFLDWRQQRGLLNTKIMEYSSLTPQLLRNYDP